MQDIPRNELLDKLDAGWKLRRKSWPDKRAFFQKDWPMINVGYLLADDWEGEPPGPVCTANGCSIVHAFERLRDGAEFIRRPDWDGPIRCRSPYVQILIEDILANDWEVWQ